MNEIEQKEIEELTKDLKNCLPSNWFWLKTVDADIDLVAKHFYNLGYRNYKDKVVLTEEKLKKIVKEEYEKALKDKVVLDKEEYQNDFSSQFNKGYEKGSKETAREFAKKLKKVIHKRDYVEGYAYLGICEEIDEIAKEYGVEVE